MNEITYIFNEIETCNFCGRESARNEIMGQRLNQSQGFNPKSKSGISVSVIKCLECSLIYSNPQPIPNNIQDHYGVVPEDYWKETYFVDDPNYFSSQITKAKELISFQEGMKALDIGAGLGKSMKSLNKAGFDTFGLEPSVTFRDMAINKTSIDSKRLKLGKVEDAEYDDKCFDFITFGAVLEHLYDPAKCVKRALNWLKPGGVVQIEVPSSNWLMSSFSNMYFRWRGTNYVTNISPMHLPYHMYEFDLESFRKLGQKVGFDVAHHHYDVCSIYNVPGVFHPFLRWYMKVTNRGMQLTVWLKKIDKGS